LDNGQVTTPVLQLALPGAPSTIYYLGAQAPVAVVQDNIRFRADSTELAISQAGDGKFRAV